MNDRQGRFRRWIPRYSLRTLLALTLFLALVWWVSARLPMAHVNFLGPVTYSPPTRSAVVARGLIGSAAVIIAWGAAFCVLWLIRHIRQGKNEQTSD